MDGLAELAKTIDENGTRAEFAEKAKISESYLSNILSGRKPFERVPYATVKRISDESGISMERLGEKAAAQ